MSQKHLIIGDDTQSPGVAGQVAAGAELEGQSWFWEPGVRQLCVLGPQLGGPQGARSPGFGVHTLPPYRLVLFNQLGIQVGEEKGILSVL